MAAIFQKQPSGCFFIWEIHCITTKLELPFAVEIRRSVPFFYANREILACETGTYDVIYWLNN